MTMSVWILVLCAAVATFAEQVTIPGLGPVEGSTSQTLWTLRTVYEYKGIQYAQAPSGANRFKPPVKTAPWTVVKDATQYGQKCPQPQETRLGFIDDYEPVDSEVEYQQSRSRVLADDLEDCLTLDVFTPTTDNSAKLPVLVYIHGGFFLTGSTARYRPGFLLEHDVILVTIQYRLGPLGFLYLDDAEAPGNMALMDQIMALEWVRDHIAAFGGDPAKVTLGGFSAGAGSASLLMLSERANGLFNQIMIQAGSSLGMWVIDEKVGVHDSLAVAENAGCDVTKPTAEIAQCMRSKSTDVVINAYLQYSADQRKEGHIGTGGCMPVIQTAKNGYETVLTENPKKILVAGTYEPRPMLAGVSKHEGIYALDYVYETFLVPNGLVGNYDFLKNEFVGVMLNAIYVKENSNTFVDAVTRRYLERDSLGDFIKMTNGLVDLAGVEFIKAPWYRQADLHSLNEENVYLYGWHYYGGNTLMKNVSIPLPNKGITHGDDTIHIFPSGSMSLNSADAEVAKRLVASIANFVRKGAPTAEGVSGLPNWEKFERGSAYYMSFDKDSTLKSEYRHDYTVGRREGITGSAFMALSSPILIVMSLLYLLFK